LRERAEEKKEWGVRRSTMRGFVQAIWTVTEKIGVYEVAGRERYDNRAKRSVWWESCSLEDGVNIKGKK